MTDHAYFRDFGQCSDEAPICLGCMNRIRELEAELVKERGSRYDWIPGPNHDCDASGCSSVEHNPDAESGGVLIDWKARAEEAEASVENFRHLYVAECTEKDALEARVAELLKKTCGHCGKPWVIKVQEIEAREREE